MFLSFTENDFSYNIYFKAPLKKVLFIQVYECSLCKYACITEEGIGPYYTWL